MRDVPLLRKQTDLAIDDGPHNSDGLLLHAWDGSERVRAFIIAAIERIVASKYQRGAAFNRQHPFVDVLFSDITESGEVLDLSELEQKGKLQVSQCECDL